MEKPAGSPALFTTGEAITHPIPDFFDPFGSHEAIATGAHRISDGLFLVAPRAFSQDRHGLSPEKIPHTTLRKKRIKRKKVRFASKNFDVPPAKVANPGFRFWKGGYGRARPPE
jgi:hypothetical protein